MHLVVSAVYGTMFGVICWLAGRRLRERAGLMAPGIIYGFVLFLLAESLVLPAGHSTLAQIPLWDWLLAHLVYGSVPGFLMNRAYKNAASAERGPRHC